MSDDDDEGRYLTVPELACVFAAVAAGCYVALRAVSAWMSGY